MTNTKRNFSEALSANLFGWGICCITPRGSNSLMERIFLKRSFTH